MSVLPSPSSRHLSPLQTGSLIAAQHVELPKTPLPPSPTVAARRPVSLLEIFGHVPQPVLEVRTLLNQFNLNRSDQTAKNRLEGVLDTAFPALREILQTETPDKAASSAKILAELKDIFPQIGSKLLMTDGIMPRLDKLCFNFSVKLGFTQKPIFG